MTTTDRAARLLCKLIADGYDAEGYGRVCPVCELSIINGHADDCELVGAHRELVAGPADAEQLAHEVTRRRLAEAEAARDAAHDVLRRLASAVVKALNEAMTSNTIRVPDRIRALLGMLDTELTPEQFLAWTGPNVGHPEVQAFAREVLAPPRPSDATGMTLDLRAMATRLAQTADELLHEPRLTSPQTRFAEAFVALVRDLGRLLDLIDDRAMSQDQARELWERTEKLAEVETALASAREEIARLTAERDRGGDLAAELRAIAAEARTAARTIPGLADVFETRAAGIDAALALATERMAAKGGAR